MRRKQDLLPYAANLTGVTAAVYIGAGALLRLLAQQVMRAFHAQATLANPVGVPENVIALLSIATAALALLAAIRFVCVLGRPYFSIKFSMSDPRDRRLWLFLPVFLGFGLLCSAGSSLVQSALAQFTRYTPPDPVTLPEGGMAMALCFVSMCIVPAVLEELLVRGCLQSLFRPWGVWFSIGVSSGVFALLHADVAQMPAIFALSVFLGLSAHVTGSLFPGMVLHFSNNALSFLFLYTRQRMDGRAALGVTIYLLAFFFFGAALCIWQIAATGLMRTLRRIPRAADPNHRARRVRRMLRAPLFLTAMVYLLARALWPVLIR